VVLGVTMLETGTRRVYAADDVVQGLGLNVLGTLPRLPAAARRAVPAPGSAEANEQGLMVEAIDGVRTVLLNTPRGPQVRVIMVSSAMGGEGKTTLASHLAASLARAWRRTLLIDCDLRN